MSLEENIKRMVGLIIQHYDFLKLLYPPYLEGVGTPPKYTLSQLADQTEKDIGYLSRLVEKLSRRGILEIHEEPSPHGRPYKYPQLSSQAIRFISAIETAAKPPAEVTTKPAKFNRRQAVELLSALDSQRIKSKDVRNRRAELFSEYAKHSEYGLCEHEEVLETFTHMVEKPNEFLEGVEPEIVDSFYRALNNAIWWMLKRDMPRSTMRFKKPGRKYLRKRKP